MPSPPRVRHQDHPATDSGGRAHFRGGPISGPRPGKRKLRTRPQCEPLEARRLMASTPGYDYQLSGESWPNPNHISYSIAPDGVFWDHGANNLGAMFNTRFGTGG